MVATRTRKPGENGESSVCSEQAEAVGCKRDPNAFRRILSEYAAPAKTLSLTYEAKVFM